MFLDTCNNDKCADGQLNYYTNADSPIPSHLSDFVMISASAFGFYSCPNSICVCLTDGECFHSDEFTVYIWPWEGKPYLVLSVGILYGNQGTVLEHPEFRTEEGGYYPITQTNKIVKSLACGECPVSSTCNG